MKILMMTTKSLGILLLLASCASATWASDGRQVIPINSDWLFEGQSIDGSRLSEKVSLPHTWNAKDAQEGYNYFRGNGKYTRNLPQDAVQTGKRIFVRFEGANTIADIELNGTPVGRHRGGYSAFAFEITPFLKPDVENRLTVQVDNSPRGDVMPIGGDFNIYGGLHRSAQIIITNPVCISPLDHASPGIFLRQMNVSRESAELEVGTVLSSSLTQPTSVIVHLTIADADGNTVVDQSDENQVAPNSITHVSQPVTIPKPHLWSGREDPYLYQIQVQVEFQGRVLDQVQQPLGIRYFRIDPKEGFFLNGKPLKLQGVSRHQDRKDRGSALRDSDHDEDLALILEVGANSVRLAHYQHSEYFYSLCDRAGLIVWAEIPFVGSFVAGYNDTSAFRENGKEQLTELIRQNFNHPSIVFWGIFNELTQGTGNKNPESYVRELHALAKKEDPERLTVAASFLDADRPLNAVTDAIAFNRYFGWYYGKPSAMAGWADRARTDIRQQAFGLGEYGAGGDITQHEQSPRRPFPMFHPWHPEEYQNIVHEIHVNEIQKRPFIWGSYVWNMFDFGVAFRREGGSEALNNNGLVTYDRTAKKDAFYLYKANWNQEPVLYITSRRHTIREKQKTEIKVYANMEEVELQINGESRGSVPPVGHVFLWPNILLHRGNNVISVVGKRAGRQYRDSCVWIYDGVPFIGFLVPFLRWWIEPVYGLSAALVVVLYMLGYRHATNRRSRKISRILFYIALLWMIVLIGLYFTGFYFGIGLFDFSQF